jgi:hypothetical protein
LKKLVTISVMLLVLAVIAVGSCSAASKVMSFALDLPTLGSTATSTSLVVGLGTWSVNCTGATTLTATDTPAALNGLYPVGKVWTFLYHNGSGWNTLTNLTGSSTAAPLAASTTINDAAGPFVVVADEFAIAYNVDLIGPNSAASGTAGLTAAAVPEPSSVVALFTGIVGLVGFLKRRRS